MSVLLPIAGPVHAAGPEDRRQEQVDADGGAARLRVGIMVGMRLPGPGEQRWSRTCPECVEGWDWDAHATMGVTSAAVPVGIINLGGSVASKAGRSERGGDVAVPGGLLGAAVVIRLLVVPCLSCAATVALRLFAPAVVPPGDAALTLVLMLESTPPPAMQCMIFCQLFAQDAERPLGKVLVATYVASLVTLTAWIALFLSLLSAG